MRPPARGPCAAVAGAHVRRPTSIIESVDTYCGVLAARAHADALLALKLLALGLECRRDRQLGAVELGDVAVAAGRHRGAQGTHQVEGPVVLPRGALDDLLERAILSGGDACAARQRRVEGRHPPVVAVARRLVCAR